MKTLKEVIFCQLAKENIDLKEESIPEELKEQYELLTDMNVSEILSKAKGDYKFAILVLHNKRLLSKLGKYDESALEHYNKFMFFNDNPNSIPYFLSISGSYLNDFLRLHKSVWEKAKEMGIHQLLSATQQKQLESHHFPDKSNVMLYFGY